MAKDKLTISIDLELAWSIWDLQIVEAAERPICTALIELFDRYEVPATWGVVAALLDEDSAKFRPGDEACWYAPDIIDRLVHAKVAHEIGSHGGKHVQFGDISASEAQEDLNFAREVHRANALPFKPFIFPREAVGHLDALAHAGLRTFRGPDVFSDGTACLSHNGRGAMLTNACPSRPLTWRL